MTITVSNLTFTVSADAVSLEQQVGSTPLLCLRRLTSHLPDNINIYAKAEWYNPGGSVKDRAALSIIRSAEASGELMPGKTILDSTSGNTGIALAMFGAARGYRVKLFLPENASPERIAILRAYGAELELTDAMDGSDGAQQAAKALYAREPHRYFYANQYGNPANWQAHYYTTAPEIWEQTHGQVTHFAAVLGTSGTFMGTARRLQEYNPAIRAISLQPDGPFHGLEGMKHMPTAIVPGIYDSRLADENRGVSTEAAYATARQLAREQGLLVGISSGAALAGALQLAEELAGRGEAATIVTIFPDNGFKYLSGALFNGG